MSAALRLAVVCCLPDAGHVVPLLRIASTAQRAGYTVQCFLPEECRVLTEQYAVPFVAIGDARSEDRTRASREFDRANVERYWIAIGRSAGTSLDQLRDRIVAFRPDIVLGDNHVFEDWYARLAKAAGARLVIHHSQGTLGGWQPWFVRRNGPRDLPGALLPLLGTAQRWFDHRWKWWAIHRLGRERLRVFDELAARVLPPAPDMQRHRIVSGLALSETRRLADRLAVPEGVELVGPISCELGTPPAHLAAWLDAMASRPIAYVTFGTMVGPTREHIAAIVELAETLSIGVLWLVPKPYDRAFADLALPDRVRVMDRAPQPALLALPAVKLCITHAGSGTVQETLLAGKPLLCAPVQFDQHYNATVLERFGVALQLSWKSFDGPTLRAKTETLLSDRYQRAAAAMQSELHAQRGDRALLAYLDRIAT